MIETPTLYVMRSRYFQARRHELAYLQFIIDSYDGLAILSTIDSQAGVVKVAFSRHLEDDVEALLSALSEEIGICEIVKPNGGSFSMTGGR